VGTELGPLQKHCRVDIVWRVAVVADPLGDLLKEDLTIGSLPLRLAVGEVGSQVPEGGGAEQCVGHSVQQNVGVRVARRTHLVRNLNSSENERSVLDQAMYVVPKADAH
jgi:hypothetical protein